MFDSQTFALINGLPDYNVKLLTADRSATAYIKRFTCVYLITVYHQKYLAITVYLFIF